MNVTASRKVLIALIPLLVTASCGHRESAESLKREAERAQRLEAELQKKFAQLSGQTREAREGLEKQDQNLAKVIPEYKSYHQQLVAGSLQIDQLSQLVAARKYGEMNPLALNGFKDSAALAVQFLQKGMEALQASIKAIDANRYSEVSQSNRKAQYFKALAGMATIHEGIFLDVFKTLLLNSPATERIALFEQAVKTYPLIQRLGATTALTQALHTAYKEEDNADNRKRMDSWLTEYKIPRVEATPAATKTTK